MIESTNSTPSSKRRRIGWRRPVAVTVGIALVVPLSLSARSPESDATLAPSEPAAVVDVEAATGSADAAPPATPGPVVADAPTATTEEMNATRAVLADYLEQLQDVVDREQFAAPGEAQLTLPAADLSSAVASARELVEELNGVELSALGAVLDANVGFSEQPAALDRAARSNPFDMNSVPIDGREQVLAEFEVPSGFRHVAHDRSGAIGHAARTASAGLAPSFGVTVPLGTSGPAPGILSDCPGPQPSLRGLFYSYWVAAQIASAANATAAGIPSATTYAALTIVTGVIWGVTNAIAIALEHSLMYAQDCEDAAQNARVRTGLATDPSAVTTENPQGFTPGSTQTSVDELGTLIGGVADDIDTIDAEIIEILADQLVVLEALGVARTSALQIQTIGVSLQLRAGDLRANIGGPDDAAVEANREVVCVPGGAPPGVPEPQPGDQRCNTASGLANTIDDRLDTILSDTADLQALSLRAAIERALADPSQPSIGLFALPAVQGGNLELVADIVTDTLNNHRAAGQGIGNAEATLASANEAYAAGQFSRAYDEYARAYRDAVR
ncbi:MAG: hypothetical protein EA389_10160 [Ilumatobacter sp.]|nr:MAG: hypothetical protein EA389_10160 [Ilumatobacter sp.]